MQLGAGSPIPARCLMRAGDGYVWAEAVVEGFDGGCFAVRSGDATESLPRIFVMFLAEDPDAFARRIIAAHVLRRETEALLRYHAAVDCMPPDSAQAVPEPVLAAIVARTNCSRIINA